MKKMIKYNVDSDVKKSLFIILFIIALIISYYLEPCMDKLKITNSELVNFLIRNIPFPSILGILLLWFDNCIWKWPIINNVIGIPNLNGSWEGTYISSFKCEDVNSCSCINKDICTFPIKGQERESCSHSKKKCDMYNSSGMEGYIDFTIKQDFNKISIYSKNKKSESYNRTTSLLVEDLEDPVIIYEHYNEVLPMKSDKGMINHSGFNQLRYYKEDGKEILEGKYYNDQNRSTYGSVRYIKKN